MKLALEAIERALGPVDHSVVATDAASFRDPRVIQWGWPPALASGATRRPSMMLASVLAKSTRTAALADEADLIVAVGGAYLRGGSRIESLKSWGAHYGQLRIAAQHGHKAVYLPQSIGPYSGRYGRATTDLLSQISTVMVRDDRTFAELRDHANVLRLPDMAIIEWARGFTSAPALTNSRPIFVARDLDDPRNYYHLLEEVSRSGGFDWAVQATGGGNNDYPVTERHSDSAPRLLSEVLSEGLPRIVVSTRLHGSLSSLIAGYPTVHLTYERKGWSAFADLGLDQYVLSARDATLADIRSRIDDITQSPDRYWARLSASIPTILESASVMEKTLRATASRVSVE